MKTIDCGAAAVRVLRQGDVVVAQVVGVVTVASATRVIASRPMWQERAALACVVLYDRAVVAVRAQDLVRAAAQGPCADPSQVAPAAIVSAVQDVAMWREYARLSLARGVIKAAFLTSEDAEAWASRQARAMAYWARCHRSAVRSVAGSLCTASRASQ